MAELEQLEQLLRTRDEIALQQLQRLHDTQTQANVGFGAGPAALCAIEQDQHEQLARLRARQQADRAHQLAGVESRLAQNGLLQHAVASAQMATSADERDLAKHISQVSLEMVSRTYHPKLTTGKGKEVYISPTSRAEAARLIDGLIDSSNNSNTSSNSSTSSV